MKDDTGVIRFRRPESVEAALTGTAREGARRMLATALEAEIAAFPEQVSGERLPDGRQRGARHGHAPEGEIRIGVGPRAVLQTRIAAGRCGSPPLSGAGGSVVAEIRAALEAGGIFRAHAFELAWARTGIDHRLTTPNHPWTNGRVERMSRTIKAAPVRR